MTTMQRRFSLFALAAALIAMVIAVSVLSCDDVGPAAEEPVSGSGGWFCCDLAGNCVWIASQNTQDCGPKNTVQWCQVVKTSADGSKTCSQWGD
jgi:hypothetical protein